jgi:hypothetical protein
MKELLFCFKRPVDWLEEADRQLYLTTPSTGNNNDCRQRRRIDFVLVYSLGVRDSATNKQRRQAFQRKLQSVGFEIEEQDIVGTVVSRDIYILLLLLIFIPIRNQEIMMMMTTMM